MLKTASVPLALSLVGLSTQALRGSIQEPGSSPQHGEPSQSPKPTLWSRLLTECRYRASCLGVRLLERQRVLPLTFEEKRAYLALRASRCFDGGWYLGANEDVARAGLDPFHHFVKHGLKEGRPCQDAVAGERGGPHGATFTTCEESGPAVDVAPARKPPADKGHLSFFSDATVSRAIERFARFPLYRDEDYFGFNEPLKHEPHLVGSWHALTYGFSEGRQVFCRKTIANELGLRSLSSVAAPALEDTAPAADDLSVSVVYNAEGNSFLQEIAECLVVDLEAAGHRATLLTDADDPAQAHPANIIVGPHEFFFLGRGRNWLHEEILRRSILYNTEQPQTIWFDRAVPFNMLAQGAIDLTPQLASIYGESMPTLFCTPTGAPVEDVLPEATCPFLRVLPQAAQRLGRRSSSFDKRSIDVSFFGGTSAHRERFFSRTAGFFADYQTLIYCRRYETPLRAEGGLDLLATARHVGFHSKIVLNIHRDQFGFFEWHRIVRLGMETGAVVVSEPCLPHPELKPNVHYFEESGRHIQNLIEWLLRTRDGREAYDTVRRTALAVVDARRTSGAAGRAIAGFIAQTIPEEP